MRRLRRCKIIATLGPASADQETIAALHMAGADLFRINMSHADHDGMRERIALAGGTIDIATGAEGTVVSASLPARYSDMTGVPGLGG